MVLGDETRSGSFGVTMWLHEQNARHQNENLNQKPKTLKEILAKLRLRDVILVKGLALHTYKGVVSGQSLHPRKGTTSIELMVRRKVGRRDEGGIFWRDVMLACGGKDEKSSGKKTQRRTQGVTGPDPDHDPVLEKVKTVNRWVEQFVPEAYPPGEGGRAARMKKGKWLPPDTQ